MRNKSRGSGTGRAGGLDARFEAVRQLYVQEYQPLVRLARMLGAGDPEDIVVGAFVRLLTRVSSDDLRCITLPYLRTIVVNLTRDRARHLGTIQRHHERVGASIRSSDDLIPPGSVTHLDLMEAARQLPARQRESIVLRYWADLTIEEVARSMGISVSSAKSNLVRARAALSEHLNGGGEAP